MSGLYPEARPSVLIFWHIHSSPCVQAPSAHPLYPATYHGRLGRSSVCPWKALDVRSLPVVFFSSPRAQEALLWAHHCVLSPRSCHLSPRLSSINASVTDPGSVLPAAPVSVVSATVSLHPSICIYTSITHSHLYIMGAPLSIIYLHMYHSCLQPSIIHHLSCRLFDVLHSALGWGWGR